MISSFTMVERWALVMLRDGAGRLRAIAALTRSSSELKTGSASTVMVLGAGCLFAISRLSNASVEADGRLTTSLVAANAS